MQTLRTLAIISGVGALVLAVLLSLSSNHSGGSGAGGAIVASSPISQQPSSQASQSTSRGTLFPDESDGSLDQDIPFSCAHSGFGDSLSHPQVVRAVRAGDLGSFDRLVFELSGTMRVSVGCQESSDFDPAPTTDKGVSLKGDAGILVILYGARGSAATSMPPSGTKELLEARQVTDLNGTVGWGLGLAKKTGFRAFWMADPGKPLRLVIDVQH